MVAISLPPRVSLNEDHSLVVGQQSSPGKHLHSLPHSLFATTAGDSAANKAIESNEETILAVDGGIEFLLEDRRRHQGLFVL